MGIVDQLNRLPDLPGVYFFRDAAGVVLYIGKALSLRQRVASYFTTGEQSEKHQQLRAKCASIEHIVTKSESDALLLEARLIRQYQPQFNQLLRAGSSYVYLVCTDDQVPELKIVRSLEDVTGTVFGPFMNKTAVRRLYEFLIRTFRLYRCSQKIAQGCLKYHLGICAGSCNDTFNQQEYCHRFALMRIALTTNREGFLASVSESIEEAHCLLEFERAQHLVGYQQHISEIFRVIEDAFSDQSYVREAGAHEAPRLAADEHVVAEQLDAGCQALQQLLGLDAPIRTIDCFDISHHQGTHMVGSSVRFLNGAPQHGEFRKFRIRTLRMQDDYAALAEVVIRRYKKSGNVPDIILVDGGKGQRSAVRRVAPPGVPVIALAKREERLFTDSHPEGIVLDISSPMGRLLIALRDYAHRYARNYHALRAYRALCSDSGVEPDRKRISYGAKTKRSKGEAA